MRLPIFTVIALLAAALSTAVPNPDAQAAEPAAEESAKAQQSPLAGTAWRLVSFQSMDDVIGTTRPDDPSRYTMRLYRDGTVTVRLDCNHATGTWFVEPSAGVMSGRFEFPVFNATRVLCSSRGIELNFASHAQYVRSFLLKDGMLYLSLMADGGIYAWEPDTAGSPAAGIPAAPDEGGPLDWEVIGVSSGLNLREQPSVSAMIVASFAPHTILDNLGCLYAEGRIWCDVQPLGGGPRGYVAAEFLRPAVSPNGSAVTGPDDSALRAGKGDFDAEGHIPCAQHAGQPMMQCEFGVARAGGGYATVVVTRPDGTTRAIFFRMGRPIGADTSQADGYPEFRATKEADLHIIRIGDERYEIPDAVVLGG